MGAGAGSMKPFTKNVERDATLVLIALNHGPDGLRRQAMQLPEFEGGPDRLEEHAAWMRSDPAYLKEVTDRAIQLDAEKRKAA